MQDQQAFQGVGGLRGSELTGRYVQAEVPE